MPLKRRSSNPRRSNASGRGIKRNRLVRAGARVPNDGVALHLSADVRTNLELGGQAGRDVVAFVLSGAELGFQDSMTYRARKVMMPRNGS